MPAPESGGRGRQADTPEKIPARGWWDILVRVFWATSANRVLSTAGSVAFFTLLAVFPGIAAIVSLYGLFADASTISDHLTLLSGILPAGILGLVGDQVKLVAQKSNNTLSGAFCDLARTRALQRKLRDRGALRRLECRVQRAGGTEPAPSLRDHLRVHRSSGSSSPSWR